MRSYYPLLLAALQSLAIVAGFLAFGLAWAGLASEYVDPSPACCDEPWSPCPMPEEE